MASYQPNFLNQNESRWYPFLAPQSTSDMQKIGSLITLDKKVVVDFGCYVSSLANYDYEVHSVWLGEITRTGSTVFFVFYSDSPYLEDYKLVFSRDLSDPEYTTEYVTSVPVSHPLGQPYTPPSCNPDYPMWGYLSTGIISQIEDILPSDGTVTGRLTVEPSTVINLSNRYVRTINVANKDRTRATTPSGCKEITWPFTVQDYYVIDTCITGIVQLSEGYNLNLVATPSLSSFEFVAQEGAGKGKLCQELEVFPGEATPDGYSTLDGGLRCDEVVRSINGVSGPNIEFVAGQGVTINTDPANNKIVVDLDLTEMAICDVTPFIGTTIPCVTSNFVDTNCGSI